MPNINISKSERKTNCIRIEWLCGVVRAEHLVHREYIGIGVLDKMGVIHRSKFSLLERIVKDRVVHHASNLPSVVEFGTFIRNISANLK